MDYYDTMVIIAFLTDQFCQSCPVGGAYIGAVQRTEILCLQFQVLETIRSSSSISLLLIPGMSPFVPLTEERVPPVFMIRIFFDMFGYLQCILIKL